MQEPWNCPVCNKSLCSEHPERLERVPHVWCGDGRGGSWVMVSSLPAIEANSQRWIAHYNNRLTYEKAMLDDQGGSDLLKPKARPKQPPLLNYDGEVTLKGRYGNAPETYTMTHMTKAEYKRVYSKHAQLAVDGSHRVRVAGIGHRWHTIFLTDSKVHKKPEPEEPKQPEPAPLTMADRRPAYSAPMKAETSEADNMRAALKAGVKTVSAPQLFVTPRALADRMIETASIQPHHNILEPSAGTGNIVDAILRTGMENKRITIVELNSALASNLAHKYKLCYPGDFLEKTSWELGGPFDRIIMNPPFKNAEDIKHINHARTMLKPGGRLVAICADGPRQRDQLEPLGEYEPLPSGSFSQAGTNVNTALVVINR